MTVSDLINNMELEILCEGDLTRPVKGGYCCDLLSWVMGRAQADDAWITVMGNVNSVAVAVLADVACIILADNSALDDDAKKRAEIQDVIVLRSRHNNFDLCVKIGELLGK